MGSKLNREITFQDKKIFKNKLETQTYIQSFVKGLGRRHVLLLQGAMGAGKTQIVNWLTQGVGSEVNAVQSPTYAFHHRYKGANGFIEHFDLDRIESDSDLESIGFWDIFALEAGLVVIEWPERINWAQLPKNWPITQIKIKQPQQDMQSEMRELEIISYK